MYSVYKYSFISGNIGIIARFVKEPGVSHHRIHRKIDIAAAVKNHLGFGFRNIGEVYPVAPRSTNDGTRASLKPRTVKSDRKEILESKI